MSVTVRKAFPVIALVLTFAVTACGVQQSSSEPVPVELWRGGDDGLTLRLAESIEIAFERSSKFVLSSGGKPRTLLVTIPSNISWTRVGNRVRVLYTIKFGSASQVLGESSGECWDDALADCANQIVVDAQLKAAKIR